MSSTTSKETPRLFSGGAKFVGCAVECIYRKLVAALENAKKEVVVKGEFLGLVAPCHAFSRRLVDKARVREAVCADLREEVTPSKEELLRKISAGIELRRIGERALLCERRGESLPSLRLPLFHESKTGSAS